MILSLQTKEVMMLTEKEIQELISKLREEEKADHARISGDPNSDEEYEEFSQFMMDHYREYGIIVAEDRYGRDQLESVSQYFDIDFEILRQMPIEDACLLCEYDPSFAPEPDFEEEQSRDDFDQRMKELGFDNWLKGQRMRRPKKDDPPDDEGLNKKRF